MSGLSPAEDYLEKNARSILQPLIQATLDVRPEDPIPFMLDWLKKLQKKVVENKNEVQTKIIIQNNSRNSPHSKKKQINEEKIIVEEMSSSNSSSDDDKDEDVDKITQEIEKRKSQIQTRKFGRHSVSAEAYGIFNKKKSFIAKVIFKTDEQIKRIYNKITQSFLFKILEEKDLHTVINAMEEKKFSESEFVIKQGDSGDVLYLVETGTLDCYKTFKKEEGPKYLRSYNPGDAFGELALLYNVPRAASIVTKTKCILWSLDRETFNNIVKDSSIKKREQYEKFLRSVDILSTIDSYEIAQICEALLPVRFRKGEMIIKQNDNGDKFYILEEGSAFATISIDGKEPKIVKEYRSGDYFGELALIKNTPRAASIIAKTDCKLLSLDRLSFKRLLGPLEDILKRNTSTYLKYIKK